jgi:hypothetical protein
MWRKEIKVVGTTSEKEERARKERVASKGTGIKYAKKGILYQTNMKIKFHAFVLNNREFL